METAEQRAERHEEAAVRLVRAMMRSADPRVIPPIEWWTRAGKALSTGAEQAQHRGRFSEMVAKMATALQIPSLRPRSAAAVIEIGAALPADELYDFAAMCSRLAVFIAARASAESKAEREAWQREDEALQEATANSLAELQKIIDTMPPTAAKEG